MDLDAHLGTGGQGGGEKLCATKEASTSSFAIDLSAFGK
jgi:hypothetical protein